MRGVPNREVVPVALVPDKTAVQIRLSPWQFLKSLVGNFSYPSLRPSLLNQHLTNLVSCVILKSGSMGSARSHNGAECELTERVNGYDLDLDIGCGDPLKRRLYHPVCRVDWLETAAV